MHVFVSVNCRVCVHDLSKLVSWWTTTRCLAILNHFRNLFSHMESRCGHVSLLFFWHNVQLKFHMY